MTLEGILNVGMTRRWPEDPRAAGKRPFKRDREEEGTEVEGGVETGTVESVGDEGCERESEGWGWSVGLFAAGGGTSKQENRAVMSPAHIFAVSSCPSEGIRPARGGATLTSPFTE